jgi:hypothetical protein
MATSPEAADVWHYCSLFSPVMALGVNVIAQVMFARARRGAQFLRCIIEGCVSGAVTLAVFEALLLTWRGTAADAVAFSLLVNVPTYAGLSFCYFAVANLGQTSIRVRLYAELLASPGGISVQEIERRYDPEAFMAVRLQRLIEGGDIVVKDGSYLLARKRLVYFANFMVAAKLVLLGRKSEFD